MYLLPRTHGRISLRRSQGESVLIETLNTPELVHAAMLRGDIAPITMAQCANVHGYKMVQAFDPLDELWDDVKRSMDALWEFKGTCVSGKVATVLEYVAWLKAELSISKRNEQACLRVLEQEQLTNKEEGHEQKARQAARP